MAAKGTLCPADVAGILTLHQSGSGRLAHGARGSGSGSGSGQHGLCATLAMPKSAKEPSAGLVDRVGRSPSAGVQRQRPLSLHDNARIASRRHQEPGDRDSRARSHSLAAGHPRLLTKQGRREGDNKSWQLHCSDAGFARCYAARKKNRQTRAQQWKRGQQGHAAVSRAGAKHATLTGQLGDFYL